MGRSSNGLRRYSYKVVKGVRFSHALLYHQNKECFMTNRSKYLPLIAMFIGLFVLSVGFNIVLFNKVSRLISIVNTTNSPVNDKDLEELMKETKKLSKQTYTNDIENSNIQYDIKTRELIQNDFRNSIR